METSSQEPLVAGRFRLLETIARGRFSALQRAVDLASEKTVVLRRIEENLPTPEVRQQLLREGSILARLSHRNLPKVLETIEDGETVYLILEDFRAWPLEEYLQGMGQPPSERLLWRLLDQMLSVIGYLHAQDPPIVNRDLRPDSLLINQDATILVVDFGLATLRHVPGRTVFRALGSPNYAAPEQLGGMPSSPRNDIYSIGATLYYLATGTHPPPSRELYDGSAHLGLLRDDLSPRFIEIVYTLMHPESDARPASVDAVEALLYRLDEAAGVIPPPVNEAPAPPLSEALAEPTWESHDGGLDVVESTASRVADELPEKKALTPVAETPPVTSPAKARVASSPLTVASVPDLPKVAATTGKREARTAAAWLRQLFGRKDSGVSAAPQDSASAEELEKFAVVDLSKLDLDRQVGQLLPESVCRSIEGVCIGRVSPSEITVAVKDPTQVHIYDHVSYATQGQLRPTLVRADAMLCELAQEWTFRLPSFASQLSWLEWLERKKLEAETLDVKTVGEVTFGAEDITSPIISAVDRIIKEAISAGASDIHLETFEGEMVVRYRIDGVLNEISTFEAREAAAIVKRVKILANLDIAQDRITQGGRISVAVAGQELDLRVSIVPVPSGESVVMRLLKKGAFNLTLRDLGFNEVDEDRFRKVLAQPYGMVLVSGPTGSGKSTTLYASLREIQRPDRKLLTIEDPIEYQMPRVTQVQVNNAPREEERRVTFAKALREFLRQDPDVILVGEIRDPETAAISVQAALTGHMLLSTIHTNDSVGIVARLRDMGVEPYLIGSVLLGGVAQRLCRKICSECREATPVPAAYTEVFAAENLQVSQLYQGRGCQTCHGTGYRGRMGLYEILEVSGEVRELISAKSRDDVIRQAATATGFRTLYQDGLQKAALGKVTLDEVHRVCMSI